MSQQSFKGHYILNGRPSILSISDNKELVWVYSNQDPTADSLIESQNQPDYKRSAKYRIAKQKKINFSSLISIKTCFCSKSPLKLKKSILCAACTHINYQTVQDSTLPLSISIDKENTDEYNSARSSSTFSSSKSPSPVSGECSLQSDSSLGFVDAESSNESGNFSAQSASSLNKLAPHPEQTNARKIDEQSQFFVDKRNKTENWQDKESKYIGSENHLSEASKSVRVVKLYYVIEKKGTRGRQLMLKSLIIEPSSTFDNSICNKSQDTKRTPLDELAVKLKSTTKTLYDSRPKRLLVFINPYGGKGRAVEIYKTKVEYIFDVASINTEVIVTEYANHAREMIENSATDLDRYDGIICVGGDGMFGELMNGILYRANKKYMTNDEHSSHEKSKLNTCEIANLKSGLGGIGRKLEAPILPIGVIGAGSTDANSFGVIGTNDSTTAALNMVLGRTINIDICSVHSLQEDHRILRFVSTFVSYGYFGDIIKNSDSLRWMGPKRYDVCAAQNILRHRSYSGEIKIVLSLKDGSPSDGSRCEKNCSVCSHSIAGNSPQSENATQTICQQIQGSEGGKASISSDNINHSDYDDRINNNNSGENEENIQCKSISGVYGACNMNNNHLTVNNNEDSCNDDVRLRKEADNQENAEEYVIVQKRGSFIGINTAVMACRCPQTKKGLSPNNHLGNGCADLILVSSCSRIQYLNYLLRTGWTKKSPVSLHFLEITLRMALISALLSIFLMINSLLFHLISKV